MYLEWEWYRLGEKEHTQNIDFSDSPSSAHTSAQTEVETPPLERGGMTLMTYVYL